MTVEELRKHHKAVKEDEIKAVNNYKSALREEIENKISKLHKGTPEDNEIYTLKEVLKMLDTITPKP